MLSTPSSRLGPPLPVFILSVVATAACNLAGVAMSTCSPSVSSSSFHLTCVWAGSGQRTVKRGEQRPATRRRLQVSQLAAASREETRRRAPAGRTSPSRGTTARTKAPVAPALCLW